MSVVTSVLLKSFLDECPAIRFINETMGLTFVDATDLPGGTTGGKSMQISLYLAAFNHWDPEPFLKALRAAPWDDNGQAVQLFVSGQDTKKLVEIHWQQSDALEQITNVQRMVDY